MNTDLPPFEHEERFHELLIKDCSGTLTDEETIEYNRLSEERVAPINAAESEQCKKLEEQIKQLKSLVYEMQNPYEVQSSKETK